MMLEVSTSRYLELSDIGFGHDYFGLSNVVLADENNRLIP